MNKKTSQKPSNNQPNNQPSLRLQRFFTNGTHPFQTIQWERRDALIEGPDGKPAFEQRDVSFPADWSQNATNIVAQKYFAGQLGSENREWSVKQLIGRVVETIGREGMKNGYFQDEEEQEIFEHELAHILVHQMAAFNSPVWFNIGVEGVAAQCSACFILHVDDHLKDITRWYSEEALIFQNGSGAGLNLSNLRGSDEPLSRGGKSSGPVTFMRAADSSAGTITSGGRCLAPDQLVYTNQGPITVQRLATHGDDFQVWSWDPETDSLVLKTARAWKQEERKTLVRVEVEVYDEHLSTGSHGSFSTSLDHPYRMRNGNYLQAMDLRPGMELSAGLLEASEEPVTALARVTSVSHGTECEVYDIEVDCETSDDRSPASGHNFLIWSGDSQKGAGVIVSNTRRAAKMVILDVDHPDVEDFIWCKAHEEKKARALAAAGFDMSLNTPEGEKNWASIQYQNANNSVRLTDSFLKAVEKDGDWQLIARSTGEPTKTVKARDLLQQISDAAWECADPGVQYDTTINSWHTCPNHSRINGSNPCCFTGDTLVDTSEGKIRIDELARRSEAGEALPLAFSWDTNSRLPVLRKILRGWKAGHSNQLIEVTTDKGITVRCTPEHRFLLHDGSYVQAKDLVAGSRLRKIGRFVNPRRSGRHYINHRTTEKSPSGTVNQARWMWEQAYGEIPVGMDVHHVNEDPTDDRLSNFELIDRIEHKVVHSSGSANPRFIEVSDAALVEMFEEIENTLVKGRLMNVTPARWNNHIRRMNLTGSIPMAQSPTTGGRIQGKTWDEFVSWIEGNRCLVNDRVASVKKLEADSVPVYDVEVDGTNNFAITTNDNVHSVVVHNSEYMHVDDSSCNLASLNLMKFRQEDGTFNVDSFRHAVQIVFLAQEILISFADYPTEAITKNTHDMRQLGMGYANLGAYLMANGLPYDSDQGRQVAGAITALMHCEAYAQSARIAERVGPYAEYKNNQEAQLRVIKRHRTAANKLEAWDGDPELTRAAKRTAREMVELSDKFGVRNAQATVLAPAGTISFLMDCDTTGVEPDFSLVKFKKLVGGGSMTIVNQTIPQALARLGYQPSQVSEIVEHIREHNSVVDAPHIQEEHYPVFDTAIGQRSIHYLGHLKMMAAVQPFLSGAISKTTNVPADITKEDIFNLYLEAWKMGLKAVAIYRDGTKTAQPLGDSKDDEENLVTSLLGDGLLRGQRRRVPDDGQAIKRRFEINSAQSGNVSGHIVVGLFEDGTPGELFVNVSQAGSTLRGFIDTWARLFSMALQYGAPLEDLVAKQVFTQFEPSGFTNDREIARAKSIPDYVVRWMAARFLDPDYHAMLGINSPEAQEQELEVELADAQRVQPRIKVRHGSGPNALGSDQGSDRVPEITTAGMGTCAKCGGLMVQTGKCMTCTDCGDTGGCG